MVLGIESPRSIIDRIHTPNHFVMKILVHVPFNVGWLFHDLVVRASLDFRPGTVRTMTCPGSPMAVIDGHSTPGEEALTGSPMHDFTIDGDYGTVRGSLTLEPEFDVKPMFYYQDDVLTPDPPETSPGRSLRRSKPATCRSDWEMEPHISRRRPIHRKNRPAIGHHGKTARRILQKGLM